MKNVWLLTKVQLRTALDFQVTSKKGRMKQSTFVLGSSLIGLLFMFMAFMYSYGIGLTLNMIGMIDRLPQLAMAITSFITLFTSIYKVKGILFGFKDYDLIMALPIKTSLVVISRFLLLYIVNMVITLIVLVPATIAYGILANPPILFYILNILTMFFIPFVPMIIGYVIGLLIFLASSRFRGSNFISILFSMVVLTGIVLLSLNVNSSSQAADMSSGLSDGINRIYFLARWYHLGVVYGNLGYLALFILTTCLLFALFSYIIGTNFKAINTAMSAHYTKGNYKINNIKTGSPLKALYIKELKRYFSSSLYVLNTGAGLLMLTIGTIATIFLKPDEIAALIEIPGAAKQLGAVFPLLIAFMVSMTYVSACSISLEGSHLWILKSSPILPKTIFLSKILVNLTMTVPAIFINGTILIFALKLNFFESIFLFLIPTAYTCFSSLFGLLINLKLPNLTWTTEVVVIKQSASSMISSLSSFFTVGIAFVVLIVFGFENYIWVNGGIVIVVTVLTYLLYQYVNKIGSKIFKDL